MSLLERIQQSLVVDRSGSVVLEDILRWPDNNSPVFGQLGLKEAMAVQAWYIWWQCREVSKVNKLHLREKNNLCYPGDYTELSGYFF